jgi:hypothetical protein
MQPVPIAMTADLILLALGSILWMIGMFGSEPMQDDIAASERRSHATRKRLCNSRPAR